MGHVGLFTTRLCASDGTRNGRRTEAAEEERVREREGGRKWKLRGGGSAVRGYLLPGAGDATERRKCGRATTPHCSHPAGRGREEEAGGGLSICAGRTTKRMAEKQKAAAEATRYRIPIPRFGDSATSTHGLRDACTAAGWASRDTTEKKTSPSVLVNHLYLPY